MHEFSMFLCYSLDFFAALVNIFLSSKYGKDIFKMVFVLDMLIFLEILQKMTELIHKFSKNLGLFTYLVHLVYWFLLKE